MLAGNQSMPYNLGNQRFLALEQRVSDLEKILDAMKELLNANNTTLQAIMDAIEKERNG